MSAFTEWLTGAAFYVGYARYGQLGGHGFVVACTYDHDEKLRAAVEDLDAGDDDALRAAEVIAAMGCWYANDPNPALAMMKVVDKMRDYHLGLSVEQAVRLSKA